MKGLKTIPLQELTAYAGLSALSAVILIVYRGYEVPNWGMWIDLAAIPLLIAFFLFGIRGGIVVSIVSAILIMFVGTGGWIGALAKFVATISMMLGMYGAMYGLKAKVKDFSKISVLGIAIIVGLLVRGLATVVFNYYYALPIWIPGQTTIELMMMFPWYVIAGVNAIQGIIDITIAWLLVYKGRLNRYASWKQE